ncbi:MAG: cbb3-type cytochrome c oxidase subunit I [Alphaproteobacteria bacterium]|nr:cbb3-type cytochrome c oxidase subunit I [Alphaproteobacteria bacterium]MBV8412387.1 cbb3-type cytochrome c oxidase subunit I [Alphaproteobacteria bacterium]
MVTVADYSRVPEVTPADYGSPLAERLETLWETKPGLIGWFGTVDHKEIGLRYLVTSFAFLILGGIEAAVMRLQLSWHDQTVLTPTQYNELFSMHGVTMIFLYAMPVLSGFSNYLWPLILGSRDMALPRLNAFSYWLYLFSGLFLYAGFIIGAGPNDGWFNYVPYASKPYNPGLNQDFYALGFILFGLSQTVGGINFMVTALRTRAPGMSINRFPMMIWGTLTASAGNLLAIPSVSLAFFMLWTDRQLGTHFYNAPEGGQPLLWQHLFWMFGHPWVYAIVLPAMSMVSDALPVFCRRPLVAQTAVALATVVTMIIGFGVWVHHMFATGLPNLSMSFFNAASLIIVVPSAISVFAWIATIRTGRFVLCTASLFFASFIFLFVIGGVSGFLTAAIPVDWQVTDTYFVVGHIHYVLIGINLFAVMGGIYFWFPKMTGHMLNERLGRWNFWLMFAGFNLGFFPMHIAGLLGMPRRIYTFPDGVGWNIVNLITTLGAYLFAIGFVVLLANVLLSRKHGAVAGPNPWDAAGLEWSVPSPPPPYNFVVIPTVSSRHPLWEDRLRETEGHSSIHEGAVLDADKETLGVSTMDAIPDVILKMPHDSVMPFVLALCITGVFVGLLLLSLVAIGTSLVLGLVAALVWLWPRAELGQRTEAVP